MKAYEVEKTLIRTRAMRLPGRNLLQADKQFHNIIATPPRRRQPDKIIMIGAHYDSAVGSEGADDNGSGVAANAALARFFAGKNPGWIERLALFPNEERRLSGRGHREATGMQGVPPAWRQMTSMIAGESWGYTEKSRVAELYFPDKSFSLTLETVGFVSNLRSRGLLLQAAGAFRSGHKVPFGRRGAAIVHAGSLLVGPLVFLEAWLPCHHDNRHGLLPQSPLS